MSDCDHNHHTSVWVEEYFDEYFGITEEAHWEDRTESACEDTSLHTYACTLCGKSMSYGNNY
jgi:hypothetical protein